MKRSAFISDIIFTFFTAFLCTLVLFRFLDVGLIAANALSAACGALIAASVAAAKQSKRKTFFLKKSDEIQKEKLLLHLAMLSDEGKMRFFLERLSDETSRRYGKLRFSTEDTLYQLRFHLAPVSPDDVLAFSRFKSNKKKTLLCNRLDESARALCKTLHVEALEGEQVYRLLKEKDALPERYLGEEMPVEKHKQRFRLWFSRSNSKRFLVSGALILFAAFVSPFRYYYLFFGFALILSAVFVRIFGYE